MSENWWENKFEVVHKSKEGGSSYFSAFRVASSTLQIDATLKNKGAIFAFP